MMPYDPVALRMRWFDELLSVMTAQSPRMEMLTNKTDSPRFAFISQCDCLFFHLFIDDFIPYYFFNLTLDGVHHPNPV